MVSNFFFFYKNYIDIDMSLDNKFFSNIFLMLESQEKFLPFFKLTISDIINFILINLHFLINVFMIGYIIFSLFRNMFDFSVRFYFINKLLNFQRNFLSYKHWF